MAEFRKSNFDAAASRVVGMDRRHAFPGLVPGASAGRLAVSWIGLRLLLDR
jgi:hypothetical protein